MKNLKRKLFKVRLMSAVLASIELVNGCSTSYAMMPSNLATLGQEVKGENVSNELLSAVKDHASRDEVERLIINGADVNATDEHGQTALMLAARCKASQEIFELLIAKGADVNKVDNVGSTPLMYAVGFGASVETVKLLISNGADVNKANDIGKTALMFADGNEDIVELLTSDVADDYKKTLAKAETHVKSPEKIGEMSPEKLLEYLKVGSTLEELKRYCESGEFDKSRQDCENFKLFDSDDKNKFFNYIKSSILEGNIKDFQKIPVEIRTEFFNYVIKNMEIDELKQILINLGMNPKNIEGKDVRRFGLMLSNIVDVRSALKIFGKIHTEEDDIADAIKNDDKDELQRLIAQRLGFNCNDKMFFGCSPIEYAALFGSEKSFKYFIMNGAEITDKVKSLALMGQNLEIIHVINQNERVFPLDKAAIKCLVCANRDDLCEWLINHFAGMDKIIASVCCEGGNLSILTKIIKCYSDENILEKVFLGRGFFNAASNNNIEMLKFLLEEGVDINTKEPLLSRTALICAIEAGNLEAVEFLIKNHANVNDDGNRSKITPLMIAASVKDIDIEIIKILLQSGADINALDYHENSVLTYAARRENVDLVKFLVENGAKTDIKTKCGEKTPLMVAVEKKNKEIAKFLIEHGADANSYNFYGESALLLAGRIGDVGMMQLLIEHGADVNIRDAWKKTPLMMLVSNARDDSCEAIKFLIENGADVNAKDINERTVMMYAQNNKNGEKIVQLLKDNGAK